MPLAVVTALATLNELSCTLTGFPLMQASLSRLSIQYTQRSYTFSSEKAARHFGKVLTISASSLACVCVLVCV
jgi:hypothetical protein